MSNVSYLNSPSMQVTESSSKYDNLESMSVAELLQNINQEDKTVPLAVEKAIPQIEALVNRIVEQMGLGGRLFYIGAGTSGRLAIVDASECPPTFGVPGEWVIALIAGGDKAIRNAVEHAEDDEQMAWKELSEQYDINSKDVVIGIAASGRTPYVIGGVNAAREKGLLTGCIVCNPNSKLAQAVEFPIEVIVGPEFVTGSTRMKAGTAQKLVLNMISTSTMIRLGRVRGNKMVDMQLSNHKLVERAIYMIMEELKLSDKTVAERLLKMHGSVRKAVDHYHQQKS